MRVDVTGISASYDRELALDEVSFSAADGEWLALIGPNGAGKSTVLKVLAGLVPHTGKITFDGASPPTRRREVAQLVAFVPQRPELPEDVTVLEYVLLGRTPHLRPLGRESAHDRTIAAAAADRLGLADLSARRLGSVSGGEAQRAVLARALCQEASLLLLDEPTTGLDLGHQQQVLELVDELRRERAMTVITSVHDLVLAREYPDRLVLLDRGSVIADGPPPTVITAANLRERFAARVTPFVSATGATVLLPTRQRLPEPNVSPADPSGSGPDRSSPRGPEGGP